MGDRQIGLVQTKVGECAFSDPDNPPKNPKFESIRDREASIENKEDERIYERNQKIDFVLRAVRQQAEVENIEDGGAD